MAPQLNCARVPEQRGFPTCGVVSHLPSTLLVARDRSTVTGECDISPLSDVGRAVPAILGVGAATEQRRLGPAVVTGVALADGDVAVNGDSIEIGSVAVV